MSEINALIEKLKAADGPDGDLDWAITQLVDPDAVRHSSAHLRYTASMDDAMTLVWWMRPVSGWKMHASGDGKFVSCVSLPEDIVCACEAASAPLAIAGSALTAWSALSGDKQ